MAGDDLKMGEAVLGNGEGDDGGAVAGDIILSARDEVIGFVLGKARKAGGFQLVADRMHGMERGRAFANKVDKTLDGVVHGNSSFG